MDFDKNLKGICSKSQRVLVKIKRNLVKILNDFGKNFGQNLKGLTLVKILKDFGQNLKGFWSKS